MSLSVKKTDASILSAVKVSPSGDLTKIYVNPVDHSGKKEIRSNTDFIVPISEPNKFNITYLSAPCGAGKSYFISQQIRLLKKFGDTRKVIVFNPHEDDYQDLEKDLSNFSRIKMDKLKDKERLPDLEVFNNSIIIFDDVFHMDDAKVSKMLSNFINNVITNGRHQHISAYITTHLVAMGHQTKYILSEAHNIVLFKASTHRSKKYILEDYIGLDKNEFKKVKKDMGCFRYTYFHKRVPQYYVNDSVIRMIDDLED